MPEGGVGCVTRESKEPTEKLERTCLDKRLRLTGASCRSSPFTCVLGILISREPSAATELITALAYQGYLSPLVLRSGVHSVEVWLRGCLKTGDRVEKWRVGEKQASANRARLVFCKP
jgi:hypothetical protein